MTKPNPSYEERRAAEAAAIRATEWAAERRAAEAAAKRSRANARRRERAREAREFLKDIGLVQVHRSCGRGSFGGWE